MVPCPSHQSAFLRRFELGAGFASTFRGFLALRSFFGIAMGGVWGLATVNGSRNIPVEARGLGSGILQVGHPFGYLIAALINNYLVLHSFYTWRTLFWASSGIFTFAALIRALVPESEVFLRAEALFARRALLLERGLVGSVRTTRPLRAVHHRVMSRLYTSTPPRAMPPCHQVLLFCGV